MVSFSEQALAAYDLLVNKHHGVESEILREVSSSVAGNGDQLSCSAEETYSPPWAPQLEVAGHRGGLVAGGLSLLSAGCVEDTDTVLPSPVTGAKQKRCSRARGVSDA